MKEQRGQMLGDDEDPNRLEPHAVLHGGHARRLHRRPGQLAGVALRAQARRGRSLSTTRTSSPRSARSRWARRPTSGSSTTSRRNGPTTFHPGSSPIGELTVVPDAQVEFVSGDVAPVHEELRRAAGERNIWIVGGGDLAGQFADAGLLDEVLVTIAPVTLGAGAPLLPRRIELSLEEVGRNGDFVCARYAVVRARLRARRAFGYGGADGRSGRDSRPHRPCTGWLGRRLPNPASRRRGAPRRGSLLGEGALGR